MHELGICDALLKMVQGIMNDEELEKVDKITVEVGSLSGVVPGFLADCWVAVTDGTELQETEFVIEELAGKGRLIAAKIFAGKDEVVKSLDRPVVPVGRRGEDLLNAILGLVGEEIRIE